MAQAEQRSQIKNRIGSLLFALAVLIFYFLYMLLRIDPTLIYQAQQPVFFFDWHFARDFFTYPGGLNALVSAFFAQFVYRAWTGALLLTVLFGSIAWGTRLLIRSVHPNQPVLFLYWIPSVFLLALHSNYQFPLALSLGLLWVLLGVNVYVHLAPPRSLPRCLLYILLWAGLFYVTAGQALVFAALVALYEILLHRRIVLALLYALLAGSLPYVAVSAFFLMHAPDAYTTNMTFSGAYNATWLLWGLYAFFPAILVVLTLLRPRAGDLKEDSIPFRDRLLYRRSCAMWLIQGAVILCLIAAAALLSFEKKGKTLLLVDYYARRGKWEKVIDTARRGVLGTYLVLYQTNRALYHCGCLCDRMFSLPQYAGVNGLFMHPNLRHLFPLQHSDVFLDLGLVNEAQHWAHEAVCVTGDTPWNLQQLVLASLLKNDRVVMAKCLSMLRKTFWHSAWAKVYQKLLTDNADVSARPPFSGLKANMPESDFLVSPVEPERCLQELVKNRQNKMAFEYYMAYCLLKGDLTAFINHLPRLNDFNYARIPRHFEEAMLIYMQMTGRHDIPVPGRTISQETVRRFNDFYRIFTKYNRNKDAAYQELSQYADTYWFYGVYYFQPEGS